MAALGHAEGTVSGHIHDTLTRTIAGELKTTTKIRATFSSRFKGVWKRVRAAPHAKLSAGRRVDTRAVGVPKLLAVTTAVVCAPVPPTKAE